MGGPDKLELETPDVVRIYTVSEEAAICANLAKLTEAVHRGAFSDRRPDLHLLCDLHAELFDGVRDHAGRHRTKGRGSETLTFGPNKATHRDHVEQELTSLFDRTWRSILRLEDDSSDIDYEQNAFYLAVWAHAELIRIHPFEDGNGRTSRILLNLLLVRFGLRPIAMEVCRQEYIALLNEYFTTKDIQPLLDGLLRLVEDQFHG